MSALPPTHRLLHIPYSHSPSRWHRAYNWRLLPLKLVTSRWQESKRGTDRWQGMSKRRANSTNDSAPSPPPGVGAFGTSVPGPLHLPTRTSSHPSGTSADVSQQQRSTVARRGNVDSTQRWMAAAEAAGKPDQEAEDQTSLFFRSRFFS